MRLLTKPTKRFMNFLFRFKIFNNKQFIKKFIISLGNPICSPTVTYNKEKLTVPIIPDDCKTSWDWNTWTHFAEYKGSFVYIKEAILLKRIHSDSEKSATEG